MGLASEDIPLNLKGETLGKIYPEPWILVGSFREAQMSLTNPLPLSIYKICIPAIINFEIFLYYMAVFQKQIPNDVPLRNEFST